jgi:hypothetical protein
MGATIYEITRSVRLVIVERSEPIIRSGFARVVCGLSPLRRGIISSPP